MFASWPHRLDLERRNGNLTAQQYLVLLALDALILRGDSAPSEARLQSEAGVSRRTVQRAKARARELGLLDWQRNRQWAENGRLREETPCSYWILHPTGPVQRRERQADARTRPIIGRGPTRSVRQMLAALPPITNDVLSKIAAHKKAVRLGWLRRRDG